MCPGISRTISTPKRLSVPLQKIRKLAAANPDLFVQTQLKVIDKNGLAVPFKYTWSQQKVAEALRIEEERGVPRRVFVLKSRQVGLSTQIAARFFTKCWAKDNLEALIIAHQEIRAQELIARCKQFYTSMRGPLQMALAQDSKAGLKFADTRGAMTIVSAKNIQAARGGTKQLVQFSEFAYYTNPVKVLTEIEQLVTQSASTEIIIETTGKGHGSEAHGFWRACKSGKENYRALFLAWQDDPGCSWRFESDKDRDRKLAEAFEYEPRLQDRMKHFGLSAGNLYYGYQVLRLQNHGDYENWIQEYPCDDEEAWRATGESFFGSENLNLIKTGEFPYQYRVFGVNAPLGQEFTSLDQLDVVERIGPDGENSSRPFIKVWKPPHPNGWYVISGDSANGEEDGNFSSSFVVDMHTLEMCAEFHGRVRPDEHAYVISSLGHIYNDALLAPEFNSPGNVTLQELKRIPYFNIYRWRYIDDYKPKLSNKLGWQTNSASRPLMLALAKRIVADVARGKVLNTGIIKSHALLDEMRTFVINDLDGRPEAANNCNDDRVMAWAIALIVASQETQGSDHDILSIYRTAAPDSHPVNQFTDSEVHATIEPSDVIKKLTGFEHPMNRNPLEDNLNGW